MTYQVFNILLLFESLLQSTRGVKRVTTNAFLSSTVCNFPENLAFLPQIFEDWKDKIESGDWKQTEVSKNMAPVLLEQQRAS